MELNIVTPGGAKGTLSVSEVAFGREFNQDLVHQAVVAYMAGARQGTKAQLTRAEVSGGGKKPWRQKGTGRARAGTIRSPIWRSGGVTFAAKPRNHDQKLNKKMYRAALQCILSELNRQDRLVVVESFDVDAPKTKSFISLMESLSLTNKKTLLVLPENNKNVYLSSRNLPKAKVVTADDVNTYHVLDADNLILCEGALSKLETLLSK